MQIDKKIEVLFESLNDNEIMQFQQLIMDRKPEESGLLGYIRLIKSFNKPVETTNEQPIEVHIYDDWESIRITCDDPRVKLIKH